MCVYCSNASVQSHHAPVDRADTRNILRRTNAFGQQTVADFPREHGRIFLLVARDGVDNWRRCNFRFRSTDDSRLDRPCLIEPVPWQYYTFTFGKQGGLGRRALQLGRLFALPDVATNLLTASAYTHVHVRYMLSFVRLSSTSVVCNVRAPYSAGWNFRQCLYAIW